MWQRLSASVRASLPSWQRLTSAARSRSLWSALGVLSASVIVVNLNVLTARFYTRWDWTRDQTFTLSEATKRIVASLDTAVEVTVFLSQGDRLLVDVRQMLEAYQAQSGDISPRFVDPTSNPAEFAALQRRYGIVAGKTEDGKLLTDTSIVVARGDDHWFLTIDDLMGVDDEGNVEPRLEQALTEGIAQVTRGKRRVACFTTGHQEASSDDMSPHGLAELRARLEKSNFDVRSVDLGKANVSQKDLSACELTIVGGPERVLSPAATKALTDSFRAGTNLLLLATPNVADDNELRASGLEPVARQAGITLGQNFVIERDGELRLPDGQGEAFLAEPKAHAITEGLVRGGQRIDFRVLVIGAQTLGTTTNSLAKPLLNTSNLSFAIDDLTATESRGGALEPKDENESGPYYVAMASEQKVQGIQARPSRMVVLGSVSPAWSRNWRDPALIGNRLFVESAVAWLSSVPALVSVPKRRAHPAGLSLTEDSLGEVLRYGLVYMPGSALGLGLLIVSRRRRKRPSAPDDRSKKQGTEA
jgi:hypothetical protein